MSAADSLGLSHARIMAHGYCDCIKLLVGSCASPLDQGAQGTCAVHSVAQIHEPRIASMCHLPAKGRRHVAQHLRPHDDLQILNHMCQSTFKAPGFSVGPCSKPQAVAGIMGLVCFRCTGRSRSKHRMPSCSSLSMLIPSRPVM